MISILMAAKTSTEYMQQAIASVLAQTYTNWELLICFNGDTPQARNAYGTTDYWEEMTDNVVLVFRRPNINSKGAAMNFMARNAQGDLIAVLDVDDLWHPLKLERQVEYMESVKADACGTMASYFGDAFAKIPVPTHRLYWTEMITSNAIVNSSAIIRREFAKWTERPEPVEDYELWLQMARDGRRLYNVPEMLTFVRCHAGQWGHSLDPSVVRELQEKYRA